MLLFVVVAHSNPLLFVLACPINQMWLLLSANNVFSWVPVVVLALLCCCMLRFAPIIACHSHCLQMLFWVAVVAIAHCCLLLLALLITHYHHHLQTMFFGVAVVAIALLHFCLLLPVLLIGCWPSLSIVIFLGLLWFLLLCCISVCCCLCE